MRFAASAAVTAALALAAGCGTTVPLSSQQQPVQQPLGASVTAPTTDGTAPAGDSGSTSGGATGSSPDGPGGASSTTGGAGTTGTTLASGASSSTSGQMPQGPAPSGNVAWGPGVTASSVTIGFQYFDLSNGNGGAFGSSANNAALGDQPGMARAVAEWINKHGGVGKRELKLVTKGTDFSKAITNISAANQEICAAFTQDVKVLIAVLYFGGADAVSCLARKQVATVTELYALAETTTKQYPQHVYTPSTTTEERGLTGTAKALAGQGFFKNAKVGLLYSEDPGYPQAEKALKAALTKLGVSVVREFGGSAARAQASAADASSAVLQMRSAGVTHMMFIEQGALLSYEFMNAAESQQYRPSYALGSVNLPSALVSQAPAGQLRNARLVSWLPVDLENSAGRTPTAKLTPGYAVCDSIIRGTGATGTAAVNGVLICDQLMFVKAMLDAAAPNVAAMSAAVNGFGTGGFRSANTYGTDFRNRHDGASKSRYAVFDTGCTCFADRGPGPNL